VNVAIVVLLRALRRRHDEAVRAVLGAGRMRIVSRAAIEAGLLTTIGAGLALAMSSVVLRAAAPAIARQLGKPAPTGLTLDPATILGVFGIAVLVAMACALIPTATASRELATVLRGSNRGGGPRVSRAGTLLVAVEIAGALVLLVACGLTLRSALNLARQPRGFSTDGVLTARLEFPASAFPTSDALLGFYDAFRAHVLEGARTPAVFANWPPYAETPVQSIESGATRLTAGVMTISDGYLEQMRMQVVRGRDFTLGDRLDAPPVALVSASLGRALWADSDAVGRRLTIVDNRASRSYTVVGVVADVRRSFGDTELREVYTSYFQSPPNRYATMYLRTKDNARVWGRRLSELASEADSRVRVGLSRSVTSDDREGTEARFVGVFFGILAVFSVLLAAMGLAGVTAYAVQLRERDSAIRLALGATSRVIVRGFLAQGLEAIFVGSSVGLAAALGGARILASRVYGISARDPVAFTSASVAILVVALIAVWLAARRAGSESVLRRLVES
jgi:predicted permease